jgi:hypothetical protein
MNYILYTCVFLFCSAFRFETPYYRVECGQSVQWMEGHATCNLYDNDVFLSLSDAPNYKEYAIFQLKIQNIGTDTVYVNPQNISLIRYFDNCIDTISIVDPEACIRTSNEVIRQCEKDIETIEKSRNTQSSVVSIVKIIPGTNKINTNGSSSNVIYQEKLAAEKRKLSVAQNDKKYWETYALRANTIAPLNFVDNKIYFKTDGCLKALVHINTNIRSYDFLIIAAN